MDEKQEKTKADVWTFTTYTPYTPVYIQQLYKTCSMYIKWFLTNFNNK